eukprot:2325859-Rhodomonas_salina.1
MHPPELEAVFVIRLLALLLVPPRKYSGTATFRTGKTRKFRKVGIPTQHFEYAVSCMATSIAVKSWDSVLFYTTWPLGSVWAPTCTCLSNSAIFIPGFMHTGTTFRFGIRSVAPHVLRPTTRCWWEVVPQP